MRRMTSRGVKCSPAEDGEREYHFAVFGLLVFAAEEVGDGPDEGGEGLLVHFLEETEGFGYAGANGFWVIALPSRYTMAGLDNRGGLGGWWRSRRRAAVRAIGSSRHSCRTCGGY